MKERRDILKVSAVGIGATLAGCSSMTGGDGSTTTTTTSTTAPLPEASFSESVISADQYAVTLTVSKLYDGQTITVRDGAMDPITTVSSEGEHKIAGKGTEQGPMKLGLSVSATVKTNGTMELVASHLIGSEKQASMPMYLNGVGGSTLPDDPSGEAYSRTFRQTVNGTKTVFKTPVPKGLYRYYKNRPRVGNYGLYVSDLFDDGIIRNITGKLEQYGNRHDLSPSQVVNNAVAIVQGMEYTDDKAATGYNEYPNFPLETLKDRGGDCEDTSILLASMLEQLNFSTVLLKMPSVAHMAVGVKGDESMDGLYFTHNGDRYYYVETTGSGWGVGEAPPQVRKANPSAETVPINDTPVLAFQWNTTVNSNGGIDVAVRTYNVGDGTATNASVKVEVQDRQENVVAHASTSYPAVQRNKHAKKSVHLSPPDDKPLRIRVAALLDGTLHDLATSDYHAPN